MGVNYCRRCGTNSFSAGAGFIVDPNAKWWQIWKTIPCPDCGGDGYAKPPAEMPYKIRVAKEKVHTCESCRHTFRIVRPDLSVVEYPVNMKRDQVNGNLYAVCPECKWRESDHSREGREALEGQEKHMVGLITRPSEPLINPKESATSSPRSKIEWIPMCKVIHNYYEGEATEAEAKQALEDYNAGKGSDKSPSAALLPQSYWGDMGSNKDLSKVCQVLGKVLNYPWYKDDKENFPNATKEDGVCVGAHTAASLADEAAAKIMELRGMSQSLNQQVAFERMRIIGDRRRFWIAMVFTAMIFFVAGAWVRMKIEKNRFDNQTLHLWNDRKE